MSMIKFFTTKDTIKTIMDDIEWVSNEDYYDVYYHIHTHELENNGIVCGKMYGTEIEIYVLPQDDEAILIGSSNKIDSYEDCLEIELTEENTLGVMQYLSQKYNCEIWVVRQGDGYYCRSTYEYEFYKGKLYRWRKWKVDPYMMVTDENVLEKAETLNKYEYHQYSPWYKEDGSITIDQSSGHNDDPELWKEYIHNQLGV